MAEQTRRAIQKAAQLEKDLSETNFSHDDDKLKVTISGMLKVTEFVIKGHQVPSSHVVRTLNKLLEEISEKRIALSEEITQYSKITQRI